MTKLKFPLEEENIAGKNYGKERPSAVLLLRVITNEVVSAGADLIRQNEECLSYCRIREIDVLDPIIVIDFPVCDMSQYKLILKEALFSAAQGLRRKPNFVLLSRWNYLHPTEEGALELYSYIRHALDVEVITCSRPTQINREGPVQIKVFFDCQSWILNLDKLDHPICLSWPSRVPSN